MRVTCTQTSPTHYFSHKNCSTPQRQTFKGVASRKQSFPKHFYVQEKYKCLENFALYLRSTPTQSLKMGGAAPAHRMPSWSFRIMRLSLAAYGCLPRGTQMNIVSCHACHDRARAHVICSHETKREKDEVYPAGATCPCRLSPCTFW